MKKVYNIIPKYSQLSIQAKAGLWFLICSFLQKGVVALSTPIFTRLLSPDEYGIVSVYYSWQDILAIIITFGLASSVYTKGLVIHDNQKNEFTKNILGLGSFTTMCSAILFLAFHRVVSTLIRLPLANIIYIFLFTYSVFVIDLFAQRKRVDYQYREFVIITLLLSVLRPFLSITLILLLPYNRVQTRLLSDLFVTVIVAIPLLVHISKKPGKYYDEAIWKDSLSFVIPLIPHFLSQRVLSQSDRIMISNMIGDSQAGIYSLSYSIGMLLMLISNALDSTMSPWVYRNIKEGNIDRIKKLSQKILLLFLFCTLDFTLIAPEIVHIFAPAKYYEAIYIIPIISSSSFFIYMYIQFIYYEYYIGKTHYIGVATAVSAVLNLVLNWYFIRAFGYIAAAYTTLACYVLYTLGHYIVMTKLTKKYLNTSHAFDRSYLLMISTVAILCALFVGRLYQFTLLRLVLFALSGTATVYFSLIVVMKEGLIKNG